MRRQGDPHVSDLMGGLEWLVIVLVLRNGKAKSRTELQALVGPEVLDFVLVDLEFWGMLEFRGQGQDEQVLLTPAGEAMTARLDLQPLATGVCLQVTLDEHEARVISVVWEEARSAAAAPAEA